MQSQYLPVSFKAAEPSAWYRDLFAKLQFHYRLAKESREKVVAMRRFLAISRESSRACLHISDSNLRLLGRQSANFF